MSDEIKSVIPITGEPGPAKRLRYGTDREVVVEILKRNGIEFAEGAEGDPTAIILQAHDHEKVGGYTGFWAELHFNDGTGALEEVDVWE